MSSYLDRNRAAWDADSANYQRTHAEQLGIDELTWGVWAIPEAQVGALGDVRGLDILELGCGGAQWSIGLAKRGARVTGIDLSASQIAFAQQLCAKHGASVDLMVRNAEATGLPASAFDLVFCDHGAMTFADPERTVPEVARLLRPGGRFVFNISTPFLEVCWNADAKRLDERLITDYFGMRSFETEGLTSFQLSYGDWIRLFRRHGFVIEDLVELQPLANATTTYKDFAPLEWARRWPAENIWKLRR